MEEGVLMRLDAGGQLDPREGSLAHLVKASLRPRGSIANSRIRLSLLGARCRLRADEGLIAVLRPPEHCRSSGAYSPSSLHFFLCFSGFLRLSGTTLVAAGTAAALRASRLASVPLSSRFFVFRMPFIPYRLGILQQHRGRRNKMNQVLRLTVLDPGLHAASAASVRTSTYIWT
jgi:hypothetical protein